MNKEVLVDHNTTLNKCVLVHMIFAIFWFLFLVYEVPRKVSLHIITTLKYFLHSRIFILNFHSLKIPQLLHDTNTLLEFIVFYHIYMLEHIIPSTFNKNLKIHVIQINQDSSKTLFHWRYLVSYLVLAIFAHFSIL